VGVKVGGGVGVRVGGNGVGTMGVELAVADGVNAAAGAVGGAGRLHAVVMMSSRRAQRLAG